MAVYEFIVTHPLLWVFIGLTLVFYLIQWSISLPSKTDKADANNYWRDALGIGTWPAPLGNLATLLWVSIAGLLLFGLAFLYLAILQNHAPMTDEGRTALGGSVFAFSATIAALGATVALPLTLRRTQHSARQTKATEEGLITDRINKAVARLGAEKSVKEVIETPRYRTGEDKKWLRDDDGNPIPATRPDGKPIIDREVVEYSAPNIEVRIGAIYALERLSQDSERDHIQIIEILCGPVAFLCRSKCSFRPLSVRMRRGFSSPKLSAADADCRSR